VKAGEPGQQPALEALLARFEEHASTLEAGGDRSGAEALRATVADWWSQQQAWNARLADALGVHHEINNALVGIRGNAQLLLRNPAAQAAGLRERLEVVLRESGRIQEATGRLRELKTGLGGGASQTRAA
jgi:nitrogen-specific signal transduction histidine kinase